MIFLCLYTDISRRFGTVRIQVLSDLGHWSHVSLVSRRINYPSYQNKVQPFAKKIFGTLNHGWTQASVLYGLELSTGVRGNSRSRPFPGMKASASRSRIMGMDFFIPFPFPNYGNVFFHSLPVPELWEWIFFIPFPFPRKES